MAYAATFSDVSAFNRRVVSRRDRGNSIGRAVAIGAGTVSATGMLAGAVTVTAAWMLAGSFASKPYLTARAPSALEAVALSAPYSRLAGAGSFPGLAGILMPSTETPDAALTTASIASAPQIPAVAVPSAPQPPANRLSDSANGMPLPPARPAESVHIQVQHEAAARPATPAAAAAPPAPKPATVTLASAAPSPFNLFQKGFMASDMPQPFQRPAAAPAPQAPAPREIASPAPPARPAPQQVAAVNPATTAPPNANLLPKLSVAPQVRDYWLSLPGADSHTAIYDIVSHTVYLPDGEKLEAHSGLGNRLDDPRFASEKARGPTPPNAYDLT